MIDLEFSKYHDDRDTAYGPYRCTCIRGQKCPACRDALTGHRSVYKTARQAASPAQAEPRSPSGRTVRSLEARRAELRTFLARWLAEFATFPLPGEMQAVSASQPRPAWALSPAMVYYAYENFGAFYDDGLAHGLGTPLQKQQAAQRLARARGDAQRRRRKREGS